MKTFALFLMLSFVFNHSPESPMEDLKWKNRIVLYFPSQEISEVGMDQKIHEEMEDRKLVFFVFQEKMISNSNLKFTPEDIRQNKAQYQIPSDKDTWILIGLDGGEKLRKEGFLDWELIFRTIDMMPMRRSEMR